jgi:hypothetical protein
MSDSYRLHAHWLSIFESNLTDKDFRNLDTLAWAMMGVLLQKTISLPAWVSSLPDKVNAATREQRFRRWLNNSRIKVRQFYQPFITQALADWPGHTLYVALDTTSVANRLVIARTAVIYRGRAIPLAWQVFKGQSVTLAFEQYASLVQYTAQLIPAKVSVVLLGDRGFRDIRLMALADQLHWHFRLRLTESEYVWLSDRQPARLDSWSLSPYQPCFLPAVRLTQQGYGPINLALVWDGHPQHDPWRIASDQEAGPQTLAEYALRMGIDFGFLDDKSAGFNLEETELLSPGRLDRLLLITALCSLYLVSLGTHVVATGQRRLIDSHWQRGLSYVQLGWRWLDYTLARDAPLPTRFYLDPASDPEPLSATLGKSLAFLDESL